MKQRYTSKDTSVNVVSAVYKYICVPNSTILDYGGGRFNTNGEYMRNKCGASVLVYDPYNRSQAENQQVLNYFTRHPAKIVVCSNVLNVLYEDEVLLGALRHIKSLMADDGVLYLKVYERDKSGVGCETTKGWQRNQRIDAYIAYIKKVFDETWVVSKKFNILLVKRCC